MRSHILILNEYTSLLKSANLEEGSIDIDYESFFTAVNRYAFLVDALLMGWGPTVVLCMGPGRSLLPHTYIRNVQVGHIVDFYHSYPLRREPNHHVDFSQFSSPGVR